MARAAAAAVCDTSSILPFFLTHDTHKGNSKGIEPKCLFLNRPPCRTCTASKLGGQQLGGGLKILLYKERLTSRELKKGFLGCPLFLLLSNTSAGQLAIAVARRHESNETHAAGRLNGLCRLFLWKQAFNLLALKTNTTGELFSLRPGDEKVAGPRIRWSIGDDLFCYRCGAQREGRNRTTTTTAATT